MILQLLQQHGPASTNLFIVTNSQMQLNCYYTNKSGIKFEAKIAKSFVFFQVVLNPVYQIV